MFSDNTINNIKLLASYSDKNIINKSITTREISNLFGIDEDKVEKLLLLKYMNIDNGSTYTIPEIITKSVELKNYLNGIDISNFEKLYSLKKMNMEMIQLNLIKKNYLQCLII